MALEQGASQTDPATADVVVGSVPTLGRAGSVRLGAFDPADFKCIVIDEAHHAAAASYRRILHHFGAHTPESRVLVWGCSATLRRHDGLSLEGVFDQIGYTRTLFDMWDDQWLVRPRAVKVGGVGCWQR